jgi:hypothetical protein
MGDFHKALKKFKVDSLEKAEAVFQKVALDMSRRIIMRTPVDTGRARANWQAGVNARPSTSAVSVDKSGRQTTSAVKGTASELKVGDVFSLVNNVAYIVPLEFGHSKKAPHGMVRITVAEFGTIVSRSA